MSEFCEAPLFTYLYASPLVQATSSEGDLVEVSQLDYTNERKALRKLFSDIGTVRFNCCVANMANFIEAFSSCTIMHFTGHGENGGLAFEDRYGMMKLISDVDIINICTNLTNKPQCVFLSACYAECVAKAFQQIGVPHIITVSNKRVLDEASLEFTDQFYSAILSGKTVASAYEAGKSRLILNFSEESNKFLLCGSADDHHISLINNSSRLAQWDISKTLRPTQCHTPTNFFMGRLADMQKILMYLVQGCRVVNISGERGIGKTEVMLKSAEYMRERHLYDQYIYLELGAIEDITEDYCLSLMATAFGIPSTTTNDLAQQRTERLIEQIREHCMGSLLLIMDGVDALWDTKRGFITYMIQRLRQRVADVQVILTSEHSLELEDVKVVLVSGLTPRDSARLFVLRAPRQLLPQELLLGGSEYGDPIAAFAATRLNQLMRGNPRVIEQVAREVGTEAAPKNILLHQTQFLEDIIPNIVNEVAGRDPNTWHDVCRVLENTYRRTMGTEALDRELTQGDFMFFGSSPTWGPERCRPVSNNYIIVPGSFTGFMAWFRGTLACAKLSKLWSRPHCIYGFISRSDAAELLRPCNVGTFLLGFSQSEPCLVVNVVVQDARGRSVIAVKVYVDTSNAAPFSCKFGGVDNRFVTLQDLIMTTPQLKTVYPDIDKLALFQ